MTMNNISNIHFSLFIMLFAMYHGETAGLFLVIVVLLFRISTWLHFSGAGVMQEEEEDEEDGGVCCIRGEEAVKAKHQRFSHIQFAGILYLM